MNYKTYCKYLTLIVFVFSSIIAFSQNRHKFDRYRIDSLLKVFKSSKQDTVKIKLLLELGDIYQSSSSDTALYYYNMALFVATKAKNKKKMLGCYNNIGIVYHDLCTYDKAIEYYVKSLKMAEELGDTTKMSKCYYNIGYVYLELGNYDKCLEYTTKSLEIKEKIGEEKGIAKCLGNIGNALCMQGKYDKALGYMLKSLNIEKKLGDKKLIAASYTDIGNIYGLQKNYDKALGFYLKSLKIDEEIGDKNGMTRAYNNIMQIYILQKKYNKAVEYGNKGLDLAKEIGFLLTQKFIYKNLSKAYNGLHDYKNAYICYKSFKQISDSIFNEEKNKQMTEMQVKYETDKKQKENELLAKKNEIQQLQINKATMRQRVIFLIFGAALVLILVISYFLYNKAKLKQKAQFEKQLAEQQKQRFRYVMEAQENERKRIAQDLHDSLGQLLSTARINVSELKEDIKSEDITQIWKNSLSLIDEASAEARNISHNLMPNSLIKYGLEPALKDLTNKINITGKVNVLLNIEGINERLNESTEITLYRIIQEILSNNLRHSGATEIKINLKNVSNTISLEINDNGKGFDTSKIAESTGIGWKNIYSRTELLNGKVTVNSESEKGTRLSIVFAA